MLRALGLRLRAYWTLTKSLQTALLMVTGVAGYASARCPVMTWHTLLALLATQFLTVAGSTVLNMVYDRDIDAVMKRTCFRPLPVGMVGAREAAVLGLVMTAGGVAWATAMTPVYGAVLLGGALFDLVVYTFWLKRRSPYSIIFGGLAGGMPILAGRSLATGSVDGIGVLLCLAVVFWIPTHIMTFNIKYEADYRSAGIPTFVSAYGIRVTRFLISVSSVAVSVAILLSAVGIGMSFGYLRVLGVLSVGLFALAVLNTFRSSAKLNFGLFKYASVYMLCSMLLVIVEAF